MDMFAPGGLRSHFDPKKYAARLEILAPAALRTKLGIAIPNDQMISKVVPHFVRHEWRC